MVLIVAGLLGLFAVLAWAAVSGKSATYDEPLHVAASLAQRQLGDYRIDPEDPAMFKRWLAIAQPPRPLPVESQWWGQVASRPQALWVWSVLAVFGQADADAAIARGRVMMLLAGVGLGALIAVWAWRIAGPAAGVMAAALFALDPNFLAHAPLAKNDVIASLGFLATAFALWQLGRRVTPAWVIALAVAAGVTVTVKFSGVIVAGLIPLLLVIRAGMPDGWVLTLSRYPGRGSPHPRTWLITSMLALLEHKAATIGRCLRFGQSKTATNGRRFIGCETEPNPLPEYRARGLMQRLFVAGAITLIVGATCLLFIWAAYGFRYAPSPDPAFQFDLAGRTTQTPILRTLDRYRVFPQAYTYGLAYTIDSSTARGAYLLGEKSRTGWWYYFPIAMAVKTPLATIAACLLAIGLATRLRLRGHSWTILCLLAPAILYLVIAMRSNLNIGFRHLLPVYPPLFIVVAAVLSRYRRVAIGVLIVLAVESLAAFPNYVSSFNLAAGGWRGGIRILSDSNLDWGQDLPLLSDWQSRNPGKRLYLSYFGAADPGSHGIDYTNAAAGYAFGLPPVMPTEPGVIAVSATHLQGMYVPPQLQPFYQSLRERRPIEILGGSIYLYDWPGD